MTEAQRGRDARNGQFITLPEARKRKATAIIESVKPKRPAQRKEKSK